MDPIAEFPKYRKWAVVGVSADTNKFGYKIYYDLKKAGYEVYGVNPNLSVLEGDTIYPSLRDLPEVPEVVNVVVPPRMGVFIVQDCLALGIKNIWFQPGAESDEAIEKAKQGGMTVVHDACIMIQKQAFV
jgi:uncharacterized protein